MNETAISSVVSPCIGICELDQESNLCIGCWRSLEEVAQWASADVDRRRDIVIQARSRREAAKRQTKE
jgi:uncharacterized protein